MQCVLAATHHDPEGRLAAQIIRVAPTLLRLFDGVALHVTELTDRGSLAPLLSGGTIVRTVPPAGHVMLGRARRGAIQFALDLPSRHILFCDLDRVLHWAEYHAAELAQTSERIGEYDCTVLGRTTRAFESHPRAQRETESIVNNVFAQVSRRRWDITAAARGLSRRAAEAITAGCAEESVGSDGAWPLFLERAGSFRLGYIATEGLEFETPDRYPQEIAAAGGLDPWLSRIDASVDEWALRLAIATAEVTALQPYQAL